MMSMNRFFRLLYSPIGLVFAGMFAGEYVKPANMLSRFLENVRGRF
jgi:hypothetical protein